MRGDTACMNAPNKTLGDHLGPNKRRAPDYYKKIDLDKFITAEKIPQ
jgi:hypothetical protein